MRSLLLGAEITVPSDIDESQNSFPASSITNLAENESVGHRDGDGDGAHDISDNTFQDLTTPPTSPGKETAFKKRKVYVQTTAATSGIWHHFNKMEIKKESALCILCNKEVYYSKNYSTGMLIHHVQRHHKQVYQQHLSSKAEEKIVSQSRQSIGTKGTVKPFLINCPKFENCLIKWMIATYQPLRCCEEQSFREMCLSLNKKCPVLSREELKTMLGEEYAIAQKHLKVIL
jgi:hypothetical protein